MRAALLFIFVLATVFADLEECPGARTIEVKCTPTRANPCTMTCPPNWFIANYHTFIRGSYIQTVNETAAECVSSFSPQSCYADCVKLSTVPATCDIDIRCGVRRARYPRGCSFIRFRAFPNALSYALLAGSQLKLLQTCAAVMSSRLTAQNIAALSKITRQTPFLALPPASNPE